MDWRSFLQESQETRAVRQYPVQPAAVAIFSWPQQMLFKGSAASSTITRNTANLIKYRESCVTGQLMMHL